MSVECWDKPALRSMYAKIGIHLWFAMIFWYPDIIRRRFTEQVIKELLNWNTDEFPLYFLCTLYKYFIEKKAIAFVNDCANLLPLPASIDIKSVYKYILETPIKIRTDDR